MRCTLFNRSWLLYSCLPAKMHIMIYKCFCFKPKPEKIIMRIVQFLIARYPVAGFFLSLQTWFSDFLFKRRNVNCCARSVNIYAWTVFASLNRILQTDQLPSDAESLLSLKPNIFFKSRKIDKLKDPRSWLELLYIISCFTRLHWSQETATTPFYTRHFSVIWFVISWGQLAGCLYHV